MIDKDFIKLETEAIRNIKTNFSYTINIYKENMQYSIYRDDILLLHGNIDELKEFLNFKTILSLIKFK